MRKASDFIRWQSNTAASDGRFRAILTGAADVELPATSCAHIQNITLRYTAESKGDTAPDIIDARKRDCVGVIVIGDGLDPQARTA